MRKTLLYYEQNAENFIRETRNVDFSELQELFLSKLKKGALILHLTRNELKAALKK